MNNRDLDRLFQEKLKNLEATPNERVWNNIESKLKKKKRRVVPFWWFASGIASLFFLVFFLFPYSSNEDNIINKNDFEIIITEKPKEEKEINVIPKIDSIIQQKKEQEGVLVADEKKSKKKNSLKNSNDTKKLVSTKNAMKKIFLAENSTNEKENLDKKKHVISNEKETSNLNKKVISKEPKLKIVEKKSSRKKDNFLDFVKNKDTILIFNSTKSKWAVAPVIGVLNSNSFSNSSPLDKNLSNSTIGQSSFSFGVQIGYQINKKWTIQTGIHRQEISYVNNKVTAISAAASSKSVVSLNNSSAVSFENNRSQSANLAASSSINTPSLIGDLNQTFGYIEIPFEIKYRFLKVKKFDTQIVAGFSSLFLNKNEFNLKTQFQTEFGKVNNLNNINFSGNFGFDFNYLFTKKWSINFNPMFKAQLNTFTDNANGFSPFNIGVYTGIKYRF